jgi:hypothetical protein
VRIRRGRVCFTLRFRGLDDPVAAHIHSGGAGENGDVVVDFQPEFTDDGARSKCVSAPRSVRRAIRRRPGRHYVNVHTQEYPNGAIRGQLARRG